MCQILLLLLLMGMDSLLFRIGMLWRNSFSRLVMFCRNPVKFSIRASTHRRGFLKSNGLQHWPEQLRQWESGSFTHSSIERNGQGGQSAMFSKVAE